MSDLESRLTAALSAQADSGVALVDAASDRLVLLPATSRPQRSRAAWVSSALVAAAAVTALAVVATPHASHPTPPASAAAASGASPYGIPAGHYLKVDVDGGAYRQAIYIPADPNARWGLHRTDAGVAQPVDERRPCGAFVFFGGADDQHHRPIPGSVPGCRAGTWLYPRPEFLLSLPRDPQLVARSLTAFAEQRDGTGSATGVGCAALGYVDYALSIAPGSTAIVIARAASRLPGVVHQDVVDSSGRHGDYLSCPQAKPTVTRPYLRGIVVDPRSGQLLDLRDVDNGTPQDIPVHYSVVAHIGD